ncbi:titin-like isoform X2 [Sitophilus oryzae]|uniref:Titin-like isoform X2 n=1 Tax=Sitophilus oryzae TaxID=7048 RepID=A0A6J2XY50_SITOR|nr:titin-like isoform X2 [Sitophilus oryzae]
MYDDTDLPENPPVYNRGDVVWVKLSGFWWPAEVKNPEDMPEDILSQFKKPPLVIVKFFDEDSYEFIKNWAQIYPYNCDKKSDFINKGMAAFRSKAVHMSKFPKDIGTAEEKTDGNPNILSLPEFLPVKKLSYHEIVGQNPNKKSPKKLSSISKKTPNKSSTEPIITHRRFLGKNDFRAFIMLQYPAKDRLYSSDEEEIKKLNEEPKEYIQCGTCSFETKRIEVMILHTKLHTKDDIQQSPTKRKPAKLKEEVPSDSESESEAVQPSKPKQRRKRQPKAKVTTTFSKILDEWDDSDADDEKKDDGESPKSDKEENEEEESKADSKHEGSASPVPVKNTQEDIKNCFDFDEEEEEEEIMLPASLGRKIPRVIPEKHKPSISELLEQDKESEKVELSETGDNKKPEENTIEPNKSEDSQKETSDEKPVEDPSKNSSEPDDTIEKAFKELMEETSVPKIDDIDSKLKPEQNFHDASTIKFPDKGGTAATTSKQPKKKFITSFDAFEAGFRKLEAENHRKKTDIPENSLQVTEEKVEKQDRRKSRGREDVTSEKKLENRRSKEESKHFAVEEPKEIFDFDGEEPNIKLMQTQIEEKSADNLRSRKSRNKKHVEESRSSPKTEETLENNTSLIPEDTTKGRRKSRWSTQQKRPSEQAAFDGPVTAEISIENLRNSVSQKLESRPVEVRARTSRGKKEPKEKTVVDKQKIKDEEQTILDEEPQVQKEDLQKDDAPVENNQEPEKIDEKTDTGLEIEENKSEFVPEPVKSEEVHVARRGRPRKSHISKKELAPVNNEHALPIEDTNSVPAKPEVEPESKVDDITDKPTLPGPEALPVDLPATESSEIVTEPQETIVEEAQELDQQLKVRRGRSKKRDSTFRPETEDAVPLETPVALEEALIEQEIVPVEPQSTEIVPTVEENLEIVAESQESVKEVQEPEQQKIKGKRGRPRKRDSIPKSGTDDTVSLEIPIAVEEAQEEIQAVPVESPSTDIVPSQQEISENVVEHQEPVEVVLEAEHQKIKGKRGRSKKRESTSKPESDDTVLLETPVPLEEALEKTEAEKTKIILETQQEISENIVELHEPVEVVQEAEHQKIKGKRGRSKKRESTSKPESDDTVLLETPVPLEEALEKTEAEKTKIILETQQEISENIVELHEPVEVVQEAEHQKIKGKRGRSKKRESTSKPESDDTVLLETPVPLEEALGKTEAEKTKIILETQQEISENIVELHEPVEVVQEAEQQKIKGKRGRPRKRESIFRREIDDTVLLETPVAVEEALAETEAVPVETPSTEIVQTQQEIAENIVELQEPVEVVQEAEQQKIKGKRRRPRKRDSTPKFETDDSVILETPVALEEVLEKTEPVPVDPPSTEIPETQQVISENIVELQEPVEVVQEAEQQKIKGKRGRPRKRDSTPKLETDDTVLLETPVALEETVEETEAVPFEPPSTETVQTQQEIAESIVQLQEPVEAVQEAEQQKIKGKRGRPRKRDSTPKLETDDTPVAVEEALEEIETVPVEHPSTGIVQTQQEISENIVELPEPIEVVQEAEHQKIKGKRGRPKRRDSTLKPENEDTVPFETPEVVGEALVEQEAINIEPVSTEIIETQQEISENVVEFQEPVEVVQEAEQQKIRARGRRSKKRDSTSKSEPEDTVPLEIPPAVNEDSVKEQNEEIKEIDAVISSDEVVKDIIETPASIPELNLPQDEIVIPPEPEVIEEVVHETRSEDAKESDISSDNEGALSIDEKPEEVKPKKGRGRRRKHSLIDNQEENDVQSKSVPPKKNRWSRRTSQDIKDTPVAIPEPDLPQEEVVVPSEPQVVEEEVIDTKESDIVSSDNDGALSIDERPKKGRGRPRKHSHIENQEEPEVQTKIVPPKKNKWSRRSSQNKNDVYHSEETEMIGEETIENRLEKMNEERSLDELILPLKKSKRVNDMTALMEEETKKNSVESLEKVPETNNSSSEDVIDEKKPEDSSSKITEANDIFKCVPPKKKKIEPIDIQDTKEEDTIPQPPKKKIQKLFETAQALEKNDMLMSPLAKKKSFLFNQEEYQPEVKTSEENHTSTELLQPEAIEVEVPKTTEDHGEKSQTEEVRNEVDVDEFFNLPKKKEEQPVVEEDKSETVKDLAEAKSEENILIPANIPLLPEPELVPIEGTLTVMSEKDLADAQVEITPDKVISEKKPMTLGTFSMDFDQVLSPKKEELQTALKDKDPLKANAYKHKSELLDILEGNNSDSSSSESKLKPNTVEQPVKKKPVLGSSMFDFEDAIPSQIVLASKATGDNVILESPKLLERLSMPGEQPKKINIQSDIKIEKKITKPVVNKSSKAVVTPKPGPKIIIKAAKSSVKSGSKPIILSEQIIRPANTTPTPKAPPQGVKRQFEDVEDIETAFVIPKIARKSVEKEVIAVTPEKGHKTKAATSKSNAKAKILQQTIRTPKESIQNMPVVLTEQVQAKVLPEKPATPSFIKKVVTNVTPKQQIIFKTTQPGSGTPLTGKQTTKPRILSGSTSATKITRPAPTALLATGTSIDGKPTKYVFVPSSMTSTIPQGKTIKTVVRKQSAVQAKQNVQATELVGQQQPVGNKIMIVTNQHGQQHRVVLTPQQQKVLMHAQSGTKVTKTIIKGGIPKSLVDSPSSSGIISKPTVSTPSVSSSAVLNQGLLIPVSKSSKTTPVQGKKVVQKGKPQKTILIKNQLGQTVRKIQGTDDAELDRQVAEQLEAIKASARQQQANKTPEILNFTNRLAAAPKPAPRRAYMKKPEVIVKKPVPKPLEPAVPALTPITPPPKPAPAPQTVAKPAVAPENPSETLLQAATAPNQTDVKAGKAAEVGKPDRPLNQLVIQDALGNQTTITEGQILALPSETVDGQPQSYMLVTLDETGNLTPLNNEALMSLDPSLGLGGDINNVVLQVDQGQGIVAAVKPAAPTVEASASSVEKPKKAEDKPKVEPKKTAVQESVTKVAEPVLEQVAKLPEASLTGAVSEAVQPSPEAALGGQQLIVTGDPVATQKFLESLSDGTTDLANILASAEGGSVIIQADGQQILIKTNAGAEAQALLGLPETDNPEGAGNPVFATHKPNQDILAAALADTDVFQQPQSPVRTSPIKSQLSPGGGGVSTPLYPPMHVGNVLETSLTLGSPIMTPLEVPSTNSKKIDDESEILNQVVPKNVDLPITITDPNISQTVAHQQQNAAGLIELALPIPENVVGANDINSPTSYGYVLPSLDEAVGMVATSQKAFGSSMPLLTEDLVTEGESNGSIEKEPLLIEKALDSDQNTFDSLPLLQETVESTKDDVVKPGSFGSIGSMPMLTDDVVEDSTSSVESTKPSRASPKHRERDIVNEGLCTLGGEMCSSLSEPPPDMFDLGSLMATPAPAKEEEVSSDRSSSSVPEETTTTSISSPGSSETSVGEIPIQPPIVATLNDLKRPGGDSPDEEQTEKRLKFDEDCK